MKLRSLFLASLAAMAMVSCSNENDQIINNGSNVEANALMQFGITVPASTRGDEVGLESENGFQNVTIVMKYTEPTPSTKVISLDNTKFTKSGQKLEMKAPELVNPGKADIYVFVNKIGDITDTSNLEELKVNADYSLTMDPLTSTIAKDDNFLMNNTNDVKRNIEFTEGERTDLTVQVDRVVAKMVEASPVEAFKVGINLTTQEGTQVEYTGKKLSIKLENYTFTALNTEAKQFLTSPVYCGTLFQQYTNAAFDAYNFTKAISTTDNITYCLENPGTTEATAIIYKAKAYWDDVEATESFYVIDGKLYLNFQALVDAGRAGDLKDTDSIEKFNSYGIKKYEAGYCYYKATIMTNASGEASETIVRNNVYKLNVNKVGDLGMTTPNGSGEDPTLLNLDVEMNKWTINLNSFEL